MSKITMEQMLRQRLLNSGFTQQEVAKHTGMAQATVGRFLHGKSSITIRNFEAINQFLQEREPLMQVMPKNKKPKTAQR